MNTFVLILTISYAITFVSSVPDGCASFGTASPGLKGIVHLTVNPFFIPGEIVTVNIASTDGTLFSVFAIQGSFPNQENSAFYWEPAPQFNTLDCSSINDTLHNSGYNLLRGVSFSFIAIIPENRAVFIRSVVVKGQTQYILSSSSISGSDNEKPMITCPIDMTVDTDEGQIISTQPIEKATARDNDGREPTVECSDENDLLEIGANTITCTATDTAGNAAECQYTITLEDNEKPMITCPIDMTVDIDEGQIISTQPIEKATATDNDGNEPTVECSDENDLLEIGANTITCTATDIAGNSEKCQYTITVVDNEKPIIICPANITEYTADQTILNSQERFEKATATDNDGVEPIVECSDENDLLEIGANTITCTATDTAGNAAECQYTITLEDNEKPIIICPANITEYTDERNVLNSQGRFGQPTATDNDGVEPTVECSDENDHLDIGANLITCTATDSSGNAEECQYTITLENDCVCYTNSSSQQKGEVCIITERCKLDDILQKLSQVSVDEENVQQVSTALANATGHPGILADGISSLADILENIAGVESPLPEVTENVIKSVDNILNVPDVSIFTNRTSSARILRAFESQLSFSQDNISLTLDNIGVEVVTSSPMSLASSLGFASIPEDGNNDNTLLNNDEELFIGDEQSIPVAEAEASILIPEEALQGVTSSSNKSVSVVFVLYANPILFQLPHSNESHLKLNSFVISGSIGGKEKQVTNLSDPVVTSFRPLFNNTVKGQAVCVFWDPTLVVGDSIGNWSTEGCSLSEDNGTGDAVVCRCDHLTNFAILISHGGDRVDPVLDVLSKIGCGISIAALILTIAVTVISNDLSSTPKKTLLNLCVSLILLYVVFLVGIELIQPRVACIIFAALIHYFFLSSVCWSSAEAMVCFYLLVMTLKNMTDSYLLRMMLFCWGIPAVIVSVTLAVPYFHRGQVNVAYEKYCFLSPGNSIYFGVLLPVGALLLFNVFIYILVFRRLVCKRIESSLTRQERRFDKVLRQARTMIPIGFLLGGTWIFGFLAIDIFTATFQYIFAILNSLIGLAVFVFFVLMRKNGRQGLDKVMCCSSSKRAHARGSQSTSKDGRSNSAHTKSTGL